jgi:hypothetical protein
MMDQSMLYLVLPQINFPLLSGGYWKYIIKTIMPISMSIFKELWNWFWVHDHDANFMVQKQICALQVNSVVIVYDCIMTNVVYNH